jgi:hypothetical protein
MERRRIRVTENQTKIVGDRASNLALERNHEQDHEHEHEEQR